MPKGRNQLCGTAEKRVLKEEFRKETEAASFEVGGGVNRRSLRHKQIDRIPGTAKGEADMGAADMVVQVEGRWG
jgi:hypothetical protein